MSKEYYPFYFVSDLHGWETGYRKLFSAIKADIPLVVFLGGDLLPSGSLHFTGNKFFANSFIDDFLAPELLKLKRELKTNFPQFFIILGNDDARTEETVVLRHEQENIWKYMHNRKVAFMDYQIYGYACVPPTPFVLKDWERYDISHFVDPGALAPEEGRLTSELSENEIHDHTIQNDLENLSAGDALEKAVFLFHAPPYQTHLDRAALDNHFVEHAPLDVHVGSIAIKRFIQERQPLITLHGHVHESARLTGSWQEKIGRTHAFSAAHDGPEMAVVCFDPANPGKAIRRLL
ncbi:MAG: metallophosphoesterase [Candidatus Aminicenantes bacterium]|nr:metallophosphoesterase [Candidatus Aminicenantes bacterium]